MCLCIASISQAQTEENTKLPELKGEWKLDSVVLYKYLDNDSIEINNNLLPEDSLISGVFNTIYFAADTCRVNVGNKFFQSFYKLNGNILELTLLLVPHTYIIVDDKISLTLYRKYSSVDSENYNMVFYGVKLIYVR
jgi:hypothetical protein